VGRPLTTVRLLIANAAFRQVLFPVPIATLFWQRELGMSLADILELQAIFSFTVTVMELPTGYVADRIGYRRALLIGATFWLAGWALYVVAGSFAAAVPAEVALATGMAFVSGSDSALLWTSLPERDRTLAYRRCEGRMQAAAQTSEALSSAAGGYLFALTPRLPYWLQLPAAGLSLATVLAMPADAPKATPEGRTTHVRRLLALAQLTLWRHPRLRTGVALMVVLSLSSFIPVWLIQPYMAERGVPEAWFGPIWAAGNLWVAIIALASHRVTSLLGVRATLMLCCALIAAGYGGLARTSAWYGFAFYFLLLTVRGLQLPLMRQTLQHDAPAEDRATVMSLAAMAFRLCFVVLAPLVGVLLVRTALATALAGIGAALVAAAVLAVVAFDRVHHRRAPAR
jgi:predicted MFS family arabinose efflux permease